MVITNLLLSVPNFLVLSLMNILFILLIFIPYEFVFGEINEQGRTV